MHESQRDPSISVVIPVHDGGEAFRRCLTAVVANAPTEIIVVADGDAGSAKDVADEFALPVVSVPTRGGPARARNLGARSARGEILFFVDADVVIPPDAVSRIAEAFRDDPELSAVFGSYDDDPDATNFLSQYKNLFNHYVHQTGREDATTFWAACGAVRRDVFLDLGGFDERHRQPCVEDIELGYRLREEGKRIRLCKGLQVKHLKRWGVVSLVVTDFRYRALPWTELIVRYRRFASDLNLRSSCRASVTLTYALVLSLVAAWWWVWFLVIAAALVVALLGLNSPVYAFFRRKRGLWFTVRVVPWHWFYYLYGGAAFAIGLVLSAFRRRGTTRDPTARERGEDLSGEGR